MNRHQRRAQEAYQRKHQPARAVIERQMNYTANRASYMLDRRVQEILKAKAPIRYWIIDRLKSHTVSRLFGFRLSLTQGTNEYGVFIGGKKIGMFNV